MKDRQRSQSAFVRSLCAVAVACALSAAAVAMAEEKESKSTDVVAPAAATPAATPQSPAATSAAPARSPFATAKEMHSYAMGMALASQFRKSPSMDTNAFMQGMKDSFSVGGATLMSEAEAKAAIAAFQAELKDKQSVAETDKRVRNKTDGEAFLEANKSKEGVVTLPSGLQYKILKSGNGAKPKAEDVVVCNYRGTFVDGKEFDSSFKRNKPATFTLDKVIKGWREALQLMPVGSIWQIVIPPDLAYGDRGAGKVIAPNSTLVFDVELVSIKDPATASNDEPQARPASTHKRRSKATTPAG